MSNHEGPSRRRRIAGESKPSDARVPAPAKKVVRKPVARPGAPVEPARAEPTPAEAEPTSSDVEDSAAAPSAEPAPTSPPRAPRVGRRPARSAPVEPDDDGAPGGAVEVAAGDTAPTDPVGTDDTEGGAAVAAPAERRRPPVARVLLAAVAVAAIAFGAVFGFRGFTDWRQTHGVDGAHAQAAESAASAAETIFTYRYDQLEQYLEDSKDVMTASFAKDFETISPALSDLAPQRKIQVQATTRDSAPVGCGDDCRRDEATVLLFVDQARLADGSEVPTVFGNRVELTMVERDGRWLVDDIKAL